MARYPVPLRAVDHLPDEHLHSDSLYSCQIHALLPLVPDGAGAALPYGVIQYQVKKNEHNKIIRGMQPLQAQVP